MKKILSLVLVVATLATLVVFAPTAGAEGAYATVETTNAVGAVGSTVTVDVIVTGPTINTVQVNFHYDRTRLELIKTPNPLVPEVLNNATFPAGVTGNNFDNGDALFPWNGDNGTDGDYYALFENVSASLPQTDMSNGYKIATLTFKIKDDAPLGDAYVEFCNVGDTNSYVALQTEKHYGDEIAYKASTVTVLPAGAIPATPTPASDFTFTVSGGQATLKTYNGTDSVVVIPSTDENGNPVTTINCGAFNGDKNPNLTMLVIPASVTTIKSGAAGNCYNLKSVYILGNPTTYGKNAIGWAGEYNIGARATTFTVKFDIADESTYNNCIIVDEDLVAVTTVYIPAGSSLGETLDADLDGWEYALPYETNDKVYTVTAGNMAYLAPANTKAPGQTVVDGKTVLAWKNGDDVVLPGAAMTLTGDTTLTVAASVALPATTANYSMKLSADTNELGMRFTSTLSKADYAAMADLGAVKLGMIITPNQYVERAGAFTKEALDTIGATNGAYVDVAIRGYYQEIGDDYVLAASLVGFSTATLAKNPAFAAVTYAEIDVDRDGTADIVVYGQYDLATVRTVKDVATKIHAEQATDTQKPWLEALLGKLPK